MKVNRFDPKGPFVKTGPKKDIKDRDLKLAIRILILPLGMLQWHYLKYVYYIRGAPRRGLLFAFRYARSRCPWRGAMATCEGQELSRSENSRLVGDVVKLAT